MPENLTLVEIVLDVRKPLREPNQLLSHILKRANIVPSTSEARRKIKAGAVSIDGQKFNPTHPFPDLRRGYTYIVQMGRHIKKIKLI